MKTNLAIVMLLLVLFTEFAQAQTSIIVPLEPTVDGLLKIHANIAGREGTFLFDSGSGISSISPEFAALIGCHPWGQITGFRMTGQRLDMQHCDHIVVSLAGKSFADKTVGVFDLSRYLPDGVGQIDGTIALDLFAKEAFTLSYAGHFIRLLDGKTLAEASKCRHTMPVRIVRDAEGLALTVNLPVNSPAGTTWFEMDSGNTSSLVLVNKTLASQFKLISDDKSHSVVSLSLADGTNFTGAVRVLDLILDGNLGTSFLSGHDVTVDLLNQRAWVTSSVAIGSEGSKR
jgi:hypothetical protein